MASKQPIYETVLVTQSKTISKTLKLEKCEKKSSDLLDIDSW